jgi:hypothetical protein
MIDCVTFSQYFKLLPDEESRTKLILQRLEQKVNVHLLGTVPAQCADIFARVTSDTVFAGYPAGRISGLSKSRIPDIRPDIWIDK